MMFLTDGWGVTYKFDVRNGRQAFLVWRTDPAVSEDESPRTRGLSFWGDMVYNDLVDGRLIAINRATGEIVWERQIAPHIEGGPSAAGETALFVADGRVIVGSSGANPRWISALDAATGEIIWERQIAPHIEGGPSAAGETAGDPAPYYARGFEGDAVLENMNTGAMLFVFSL